MKIWDNSCSGSDSQFTASVTLSTQLVVGDQTFGRLTWNNVTWINRYKNYCVRRKVKQQNPQTITVRLLTWSGNQKGFNGIYESYYSFKVVGMLNMIIWIYIIYVSNINCIQFLLF